MVNCTRPRLTSSMAMLVFLRRSGSAMMRGRAPRVSCLFLKAATTISRKTDSTPERCPSLSVPPKVLQEVSFIICPIPLTHAAPRVRVDNRLPCRHQQIKDDRQQDGHDGEDIKLSNRRHTAIRA